MRNRMRNFPTAALRVVVLISTVGLLAATVEAQGSLTVNRIIWVNATGTALANCAALRNVLSGLGPTSDTNRYLIKLEPGVYDCGRNTVSVPSYVAIEGAGQQVTIVTGTRSSFEYGVFDFFTTVDAELRSLSVRHEGPFDVDRTAISVFNGRAFLSRVSIVGPHSGTGAGYGLWVGASGENKFSVATVRESTFFNANTSSAHLHEASSTSHASAKIYTSEFDKGISASGDAATTSVKCAASWDGQDNALDRTCTRIP